MAEFWQWFDDYAAPRLRGRDKTFRKMFEHLDKAEGPVHIVETGCIEDPDNWAGNGCSTILFDRYAHSRPGSTVRSVDIIPEKVEMARQWVNGTTEIVCGDSVQAVAEFAKDPRKINLLYLDASHLEWKHPVPSSHHHLCELMAAKPMLTPDTLVAVDDSPAVMDGFARIEVSGKGAFVGKYALDVGAKLEFLEYQVGWTGMVEGADGPQTTLDLALLARDMIEADNSTAADPIYRKLLDITSLTVKPWDSVTRVARGEACVFFARMALAHGHVGAAMDWFNEALRVDPKAVEYRIELATRVYLRMEMLDLAVREATRATEIEPMNPRAWRALGSLEHENNHAQAAIAAYDMALKVAPGDPEATLDRTTVAMDVEDYGLVKRLCEQLRFTKHWPDALHILGMAAYREDRHEAAVELFEQAIAAGCRDVPTVRWHQSHALESIGRYREANKARAHRANSRLRPTLAMPFQRFNLPLWEGQPGPATIHVHSESGAGDNICLVRYLPMLTARGYKVHYEGHEGMLELVARSMPEVDVMPRATNFPGALGLKSFDYHLPIGEIQNAFDTDIDTVPWNGPYLHPGEEAVERYRDELPNGKKIGLCWSSGIRTNATWLEKYGLRKSMHFDVLRTVIKRVMGDLTYVSLQVGPERIQHGGALIDVLPEYPDWDDTAALIANLDLVITVDTAVAHMAGAMGKPTWLMMHPGGSWHWMVERPGAPWNEASPWYPSVRIFRQDKPGDWGGVISRVAEALRHVGT